MAVDQSLDMVTETLLSGASPLPHFDCISSWKKRPQPNNHFHNSTKTTTASTGRAMR